MTTVELNVTEPAELAVLKDEFARTFGVREAKWSAHNFSRMLRSTGERPERIAEIRSILVELGLGAYATRYYGMLSCHGVFDHGTMWVKDRSPRMLVGHAYDVSDDDRKLLAALARFTGALKVSIDDRPSFYGYCTHHVRIELAEVMKPFGSLPSTPKTRLAARAARQAFTEAFAD